MKSCRKVSASNGPKSRCRKNSRAIRLLWLLARRHFCLSASRRALRELAIALSVILIVPMCILAAMLGVTYRDFDRNILVDIGLVVLVGLAAKNAILIVEFAKQAEEEGHTRFEAAVSAARTRLRPILMTSFAFILGVLPLAGPRAPAPKCVNRSAPRCSPACSASRCLDFSSPRLSMSLCVGFRRCCGDVRLNAPCNRSGNSAISAGGEKL